MEKEYKYFKNEYIDNITNNYFKPILDDVFRQYSADIKIMADVGCGNGIFSSYLKKVYDIQLYGFDASEYALSQAINNGFDKVSVNEDFSTRPLPVDDGYFDFVLNKDVLEHLLDPLFLMKEIKRVLKPEGLLLLHVPNDFNLWKRIRFVFTNSIDTYKYCPGAKQWDWPHIRFFTYDGIRELLQLCGFEIIRNYSYFFAWQVPVINRIPGYSVISRIVSNKFPSQFCQGITVLVKKRQETNLEEE